MFRLIKLAIYVGIGYALYELLHTATQPQEKEEQEQPQQQPQRKSNRRPQANRRPSHPQNLTGPAHQGRRVHVATDEGTAQHTETVGRGVVRR